MARNSISKKASRWGAAAVEELEGRQMLSVNVLTYHNDSARTGANLAETALTTTNVDSASFGKLFSYPVDGYVYGQPLLVSGVNVAGKGVHNIAIVVTEHDSVYAFDADSNARSNASPLWHVSFLNAREGITTIPDPDTGSDDIVPEIGITSTPVIDMSSGTVYVLAKTKQILRNGSVEYAQQLHALNISSGAEKFHGPATIAFSTAGTGTGSDGSNIAFQALIQNQRSALTLANGDIYVAWASHGDNGPYHGMVASYKASNLRLVSVWNVTPDGDEAGIWEDGDGPAVDAAGNVYVTTGNGTFDANTGGSDYGDSAVKLSAGTLAVQDYFTPSDQATLDSFDQDLDSGGVVVLPPQRTADPNLIVFGGKEGTIYLVNRDDMGQFNGSSDNVYQELPGAMDATFDTPAYFNASLYYVGVGDHLQQYQFQHGSLTLVGSSIDTFGFPGASPSISANGKNNGIVWLVSTEDGGRGVLLAYNANNVGQQLYDSDEGGSRGTPGGYVKFSVPSVANGKVYVGSQNSLSVYGIIPVRGVRRINAPVQITPGMRLGAGVFGMTRIGAGGEAGFASEFLSSAQDDGAE